MRDVHDKWDNIMEQRRHSSKFLFTYHLQRGLDTVEIERIAIWRCKIQAAAAAAASGYMVLVIKVFNTYM